jgi:hypothetical protein
MDERSHMAALAMQGILIGIFGELPNAKPPPDTIAAHALEYADALREAIHKTPDPLGTQPCPPPKV